MSKIFDRTTAPGANDDASPLPDILGSQYTAMCRWAGVEDAYSGSLNFIFSSAAEPKNPKVAAFPTSRTEPRQDTVSNDSPRLVGPLPRPAIPSEEYVASARPPGCTFQYHNRFAFTLTFFFTSHSSHSHSHSLSPSFASTFAFALTPYC
jgi:hypothetical protein